jgi:hypothetical protein
MLRTKTKKLSGIAQGSLSILDEELESNIHVVVGVAVSSNRQDLAWARGSIRLEISGTEIVSRGEPARSYMFGINHPSRRFDFGELDLKGVTNRRIRLEWSDTDVVGATFSPYDVDVTVYYKTQN